MLKNQFEWENCNESDKSCLTCRNKAVFKCYYNRNPIAVYACSDCFPSPFISHVEKVIQKREALNDRMKAARVQKINLETEKKMKTVYIRETNKVKV